MRLICHSRVSEIICAAAIVLFRCRCSTALSLGGGCEMTLHADKVVAAAEHYRTG